MDLKELLREAQKCIDNRLSQPYQQHLRDRIDAALVELERPKETIMTKNWTPEPWKITEGYTSNVTDMRGNAVAMVFDAKNRERIVACVNAMAGVDDPQGFVERAKIAESDFPEMVRRASDPKISFLLGQVEELQATNRELVEALEKLRYLIPHQHCHTCEQVKLIVDAALKRAKGE